ncbi:MAG: hypothetical protein GY854_25805 [Deltaproteobacteria bacterium]|nr:hypothetical protein [Deltaproteobacteria bacterium]
MSGNLFHYRLVLGLVAIFTLVGCNSSPTVPLPPPELVHVDPPDEDGFSLIKGEPGAAEEDDVILVFNKTLGEGVMTVAEKDGSFEVEIEAEIGDKISLQIKRDDTVSDDELVKEVEATSS